MGQSRLKVGEFGEVWVSPRMVGDEQVGWQARRRYRDMSGLYREVSGTGSTKGGARRRLDRNTEAAQAKMAAVGVLSASMTVAALLDAWLIERRHDVDEGHLKPQSLNTYRNEIRLVLLPAIGALTLTEANATRLHAHLRAVERTGRSTRHARTILRQAFQHAVDLGLLPANPMLSVGGKKTRRKKRKKRGADNPISLSPEQVAWVVHAVQPRRTNKHGPAPNWDLADLVDSLRGTGTRIGESLALRWVDLHLDAEPPIAHICGTLVPRRPPEVPEQFRQPYTKKGTEEGDGDRWVVLPPETVAMFKARRKRTPFRRQHDPVFATRNGTFLSANNLRTRLRRALAADPRLAGVWIKPHSFRGSYLTRVAEMYGIEAAQVAAGHADPSTTRRYYVQPKNVAPDARAALADLLRPPAVELPDGRETQATSRT